MAGSGRYQIEVSGLLDDSKIRAKLASIQKQINSGAFVGGTTNGKSNKDGSNKSYVTGMKKAEKATKSAQKQMVGFEKSSKRAGSELLNMGKKVVGFGAVTSAIQLGSQGIKSMVGSVVELDSALREYKKVSNLSGKGLEEFTAKAYKAGKQTAKTGVEMIDASTQFKKMGYSDDDSLKLAKTATLFQNIADTEISAGESAAFINSQLKAFRSELSGLGDEGAQAMHVIDGVNEVKVF